PIAEALTKTCGGLAIFPTVSAISFVPLTRLSRIRVFRVAVQRPSAMVSPARCTTASTPFNTEALTVPASGAHSAGRLIRTTSWPPFVNIVTRAEPMSAVDHVTALLMNEIIEGNYG